jgi:pyruvate dehydrogenase E2 component (dihydrolipoamide acetyltransferase)
MIDITIPKLGLTMESARIAGWKFRSGDEVKKGQTVLVIETDKVTYEVPAPETGIIHPVAPAGKDCAVEEIIGYIAETLEEYEAVVRKYPPSEAEETEEVQAKTLAPPVESPLPPAPVVGGRMKASPLARSMAAARGLDLALIRGTGPRGRIVRADILRAMEERATGAEARDALAKEVAESIPIRGIRKIIFDNMVLSLSHSAQLTIHTEASAESLLALKERLSSGDQEVSYNAILVKIAAMALRAHPRINASVQDGAITVWKQVHIGLAMEANDALIVPVVRSPDLKAIREIDAEITALVKKVRQNRLSPDDLVNGTFTITNLGFAEVDYFTPIIRPPESAILGVGRIAKKAVVKDDHVIPGARIGLSLTFDHRIIDGAPAARFLKTIQDLMEAPLLMMY